MARFDLPLNLPPGQSVSTASSDVLQQEAIKAIRLELNWRKPISHIHHSRSVSQGPREPSTHMQFVPGGQWLLTVQKYHRLLMTRLTTRISVWSFADIDNPRCVFKVELTGVYLNSAIALKPTGDSATLVLGIEEDFRRCACIAFSPLSVFNPFCRFIEIRTISLRESIDSSYMGSLSPSPERCRRLELPPYPVQGDKVIQDTQLTEGTLVVTVASFNEHHELSWHILLMNPDAGGLHWVEPRFTKVFSFHAT